MRATTTSMLMAKKQTHENVATQCIRQNRLYLNTSKDCRQFELYAFLSELEQGFSMVAIDQPHVIEIRDEGSTC